ncbi:MAG: hypothetical protein AB1427_09880 [Thermodesulfobacteriota bacterium]
MLKTAYYIAVILTAIAAWMGFIYGYWKPKSPFEAKLTFGSPVLKKLDEQVSVTLGIAMSNLGGHSGCVADMALSIESEASKTRWALMPTWFIEMKSYLRGIPGKEDIVRSINGTFSQLILPANSIQNYSVFFMPRAIEEPKIKPLSYDDLIPGDTYNIKLFMITTKDNCLISEHENWKFAGEAQFLIQNEHLKALNEGLAVIPLDVARDKARNRFIKR